MTVINKHLSNLSIAWFAMFVSVFVGCQREPTLGIVAGKVTLNGTPVSQGRISFNDASQGIFMTADLRPDGSYEIVRAEGRGLPPGTYRVAIAPPAIDLPVGSSSAAPPQPPSAIPAKYQDVATSGLELSVQPEANVYNVDLQH
jgi:hypothetical protein